ncbi:hypothetical protein JWG42_12955 [Desulfoprunum benzoelyticum]|uniref:Uncharacterized protein n=1 Tax=Desulfoprunum benzoelyticum TaxID=1506996 RepID=A0A840UWQ6_9BACT|nr:hypothetical protein [Desulfoprunum benzoelyticum]MBB5349363.1 hypothetical protein [Desulfoprunum benzoelyticum]MBM9531062.1 hypothetical protein [Desulfoprunum benzoelyticum]
MNSSSDLSRLELQVNPEDIPLYTTVLQGGILVKARAGIPLGSFLDALPGFNHDYIVNVIQTIFLDGTAIDDLETPIEGDHPVLALSAAMPGLAGAILRKNSYHAALRTTVTERRDHHQQGSITITLKLFNSIARDCGPALLAAGIRLNAAVLRGFCSTHPTLAAGLRHIVLDGRPITADSMSVWLEQEQTITLIVREAAND